MFNNLLNTINNYLYSNLLIILLVFTGLFFSIRTRFIQIRMLKEGLKLLGEKNKDTKGISSFQALMESQVYDKMSAKKYHSLLYRDQSSKI